MPDNIFLCGLSGSGKSTIAPLLAQQRGCEWVDTDTLVVAEAGMPIGDIFAGEGESGFRAREARAVASACERRETIVALGGGSLDRDDSFERVRSAGTLVFLDAADEILLARLSKTGNEVRPLLSQPGALARLRERRLPRFSQADIMVDTGALSPEDVVAFLCHPERRSVQRSVVEGQRSE